MTPEEALKRIIFDQYSRYHATAEVCALLQAQAGNSILDIGSGEACLLGQFLPAANITFLDPLLRGTVRRDLKIVTESIFDTSLPEGAFDIVASVDTFEHIPPDLRQTFLDRICRLSKESIVLAFPNLESESSIALDTYINDSYRALFGEDYPWLKEHKEYGLPSALATQAYLEAAGYKVAAVTHGRIDVLKELLPPVLFAIELGEFQGYVEAISERFNQTCIPLDWTGEGYRTILVATKKQLPRLEFASENSDGQLQEAMSAIRETALMPLWRSIQGTQRFCSSSTDEVSDQIAIRDREFLLLQKKLRQESKMSALEIQKLHLKLAEMAEWGESATATLRERDTEILRLQGLLATAQADHQHQVSKLQLSLDEMTAWGKKSSEEVALRDVEIRRLQKSAEAIRERDEEILRLQTALNTACAVHEQQIASLQASVEKMTSWGKQSAEDVATRDAEIRRLQATTAAYSESTNKT